MRQLARCKKNGCRIALNTDAHSILPFGGRVAPLPNFAARESISRRAGYKLQRERLREV